MKVSGVGAGSQRCLNNYILQIALHSENYGPSIGTVDRTPAVENSDPPGLLGLQSMRDHRVVLDLQKLKMYFVGPGDYDLDKALSPGTVSFELEVAPSGHLLLPCSNFANLSEKDSVPALHSAQQENEVNSAPVMATNVPTATRSDI